MTSDLTPDELRARLLAWTRDLVSETLGPLRRERRGEPSPAVRGLLYQLEQGLGTVWRHERAARSSS